MAFRAGLPMALQSDAIHLGAGFPLDRFGTLRASKRQPLPAGDEEEWGRRLEEKGLRSVPQDAKHNGLDTRAPLGFGSILRSS